MARADQRERRIGFIGAGVLGSGLALALCRLDYKICAVSSRSRGSAEALAARVPGCSVCTTDQEVADDSDLVFITTPDSVITPVAASVRWRTGHEVVHCCGASGRDILQAAADQGAKTGAFHPFQTFAGLESPDQAIARLSGVTFAISAEEGLEGFLRGLAEALDGRAVTMDDELRSLYHASAVLSCGYLVTLLQAAVGAWQAAGLTEEEGLDAVVAVSRATLENVARLGPKASVTGPLVRGDVATVRRHLSALVDTKPELAGLYAALTHQSLLLAREIGLNSDGETVLRQELADYGFPFPR